MQSLCATTLYGGGPAGQNLGGWCDDPGYERTTSTGLVSYDINEGSGVNTALANVPRIFLGCMNRCFCNANIQANPQAQPKLVGLNDFQNHGLRPRASQSTYELQIDVVDDFTTDIALKMGKSGDQSVLAERVWHYSRTQVDFHIGYVSLDKGNMITCFGRLPTFTLPPPYDQPSDFRNNQELCATHLSGGLAGANAGGYCHRSTQSPLHPVGREVFFSDELTPRLDWTWAGGDFFFSAAVRYHCWSNCMCNDGRPKAGLNTTYWHWIRGHPITAGRFGDLKYSSGTDQSGQNSLVQILPKQSGPGSSPGSSGTCGPSGKDFCPQAFPSDLGPVPRAPAYVSDVVKDESSDLTVCGSKCSSNQDCHSTLSADECVCAYPNSYEAQTLGLDPVLPPAVCLALAIATFKSNLPKRGGYINVDSNGEPRRCRCNATFTDNACCGSKTGMVWLEVSS
ncbi:hypothetical protein MMC21_004864 [Puttea exsequens]|nr:hypothetical protein [Puttea exsequens]